MTIKDKEYHADSIQVLSDREHVRLRTQIYLGNMSPISYPIPLFNNELEIKNIEFIPAVYKAVGEIIDNSIDEFAQIQQKNKVLTIESNPILGTYTIGDNGRGIPISKHKTGKYTPEVALGALRAGRNFGDDKDAGVIGQNGVGSACTNYCSSEFAIDIHRDGKRYRQKFSDGALNISKPSIRKGTAAKTGTSISFQLDNNVFSDTTLPEELIHNRAIEIALTNPGVTVEYNKKKYKFRRGLEDMVKKISDNDYFKFFGDGIEFYIVPNLNNSLDEQMFTWVNSSLLFDGGLCNTQFMNAFTSKTIEHLASAAKRKKIEVTKNDIKRNMLIFGSLKIADPEYDAQSKTRLTGPNMRSEMSTLVDTMWSVFARRNKDWLDQVLDHAMIRHHGSADKEAIKDLKKNSHKKVAGLVDANSTDRMSCTLLVTEGDSAASMITEARNPQTTASLPLRGKINNTFGCTVAQLLKMEKIAGLLAAVGLVPGKRALRSELRYGKIVIATDADVDGGDIFTLLINMFYQYWPELFDPAYPPIIYRLIAPNVALTKKNKQRIHFPTLSEYNTVKSKYASWTVEYYKGLGSMEREDWEMILTGETDTLIPVVNDGKMGDTLHLLFSKDTDARKEWLQH